MHLTNLPRLPRCQWKAGALLNEFLLQQDLIPNPQSQTWLASELLSCLGRKPPEIAVGRETAENRAAADAAGGVRLLVRFAELDRHAEPERRVRPEENSNARAEKLTRLDDRQVELGLADLAALRVDPGGASRLDTTAGRRADQVRRFALFERHLGRSHAVNRVGAGAGEVKARLMTLVKEVECLRGHVDVTGDAADVIAGAFCSDEICAGEDIAQDVV